jgi:hypothetical protein
MTMTGMTRATVTCTICGDQQTFLGSQREVTVAAQVWETDHGPSPLNPNRHGRVDEIQGLSEGG